MDNTIILLNPARNLMMKKDAYLNKASVKLNGRYANPVSVLFRDTIQYKITGVFVDTVAGNMVIRDTLPPYMVYDLSSISGSSLPPATLSPLIATGTTGGTPSRQYIHWTFGVGINFLNPLDSCTVEYKATPANGACASQPLYINYAWVNAVAANTTDTIFSITNSTYHQGAGVSVVTFSASVGGQLLNAREQALDFRTSPRAGVLIVPDSGYRFAGWSHDEYISLRGERIPADSGIARYEDVVIYGNVELRADFVPLPGKQTEEGIIQEKIIDTSDKVWSHDRDIFVRTRRSALTHIYSTDGVLLRQVMILDEGITSIQMERGIYIVTIDDGPGWKVMVEGE
jgi:hypothetical protein